MPEPWTHEDTQRLHRLCAHYGIATDYHDIWGTRHPVAQDHLLALLGAFDVAVDSPASVAQALQAAEHDAWRQPLPPVVAVQAGNAAWHLTLRLPAAQSHIRWTVADEEGLSIQGEADAHALPEIAHTEVDGVRWTQRRFSLGLGLTAGYHRLSVEGLDGETLIVSAPERCYRPPAARDGGRVWGPAVQLYSLRSRRNWGIGDFGDLEALTRQMAQLGADVIGLNPLHALFPHNPAHTSPYSPSSRRFLNVLYIDVEAVRGFDDCAAALALVRSPEFQGRLAGLRSSAMVDHVGVAAAKFEVLELLFADFRERHLWAGGDIARDEAGREFIDFVERGGEALRRHALCEALQAHFHAEDASVWGWQRWPEAFRDPASAEVAAFAADHADRVQYHQYLQWQATTQLAHANARCDALGLGVGLYLDLAVSVDRAGSDVWGARECFADEASVGAPPDEFNPNGQGWGLPPLRPDRLRATQYRLFIDTLRASMSGAGALRIDHVMGLLRLFWIPAGQTARDGAYVYYAMDEMLAIVALESQRNRCMVIGEDLGTVSDELRAAMTRFDVLSYRLLYFERQADGEFIAPADYPRNALVSVSTHDLATLPGWWAGEDLRVRLSLGLFPKEEVFQKQLFDRAQERVRLLFAMQREGLLSGDEVAEAAGSRGLAPHTVQAVHAFLASTPSTVMMMQLDDVMGVIDQANMPGTSSEQPNWRRKMPADLQAIAEHDTMRAVGARLAELRPRRLPEAAPRDAALLRIPRATYRLQFHKDFGFDDAVRILPYLAHLGVSHVYCSPIQRASAGSMHGYDVVAHDEINPELGGPEGYARFCAALREHGMGQLLDMVPNHMGVFSNDNAWWTDVLENGPASLYAQHFDIDWHPLNPELTGKVLLPVLGDHYGDVLTNGDLVLHFDAASGGLALHYFEHHFPVAPESYPLVFTRAQEALDDPDLAASLGSIATAFGHLPGRATEDAAGLAERARDKELLKTRLARLAARQPLVAQAIFAAVAEMNLPEARDELHALIEAQAFRLAYWRVAADEINYRRFFDINELAALRMEREDVFRATQSFALDLAAAGAVDGLRIDHPDGLYDPASYFRQLQEGYARRAGLLLPEHDADGRPARPLYVVAEKIAAPHEEVPESWHIHGTTGYRFANVANGVLVDTTAAARFEAIWHSFTGSQQSFEELGRIGKRDIMRTALSSELNVLSTELLRIARASRSTRDYTLNTLRRALSEVAACMPVYRTYVIDSASAQDVRYVDWAVRDAERHSQDADLSVFAFLRRTLLGEAAPGASPELAERVRRFATRFQQFSAPVAAKGVEDTAFYRYFPLSALNEVGGEPAIFGMTLEDFHRASADRAKRWPHTMLATSTHDNKRSEDVRNRIDVLSEMPAAWRLALRRWRKMNERVREKIAGRDSPADAPSEADEYLLYQTLLGTLPPGGLDAASIEPFRQRIVTYMRKAARESKMHTRWTLPNEAYEAALEGFIGALLGSVDDNPFLDDIQPFAAALAWFGAFNSLSLMLLKYGSPGVPDLYQGNELTDYSLVDPDNRRPVDYDVRERLLESFDDMAADKAALPARVGELLQSPCDGRAKLWIIWRLLSLRREQPLLFRDGDYQALPAHGARSRNVVAFMRRHEDQVLVMIVGRLFWSFESTYGTSTAPHVRPVGAMWEDTTVHLLGLPEGCVLENVLTGERFELRDGVLRLADVLASLPGAALRVVGG